jgi:hypothetical protein
MADTGGAGPRSCLSRQCSVAGTSGTGAGNIRLGGIAGHRGTGPGTTPHLPPIFVYADLWHVPVRTRRISAPEQAANMHGRGAAAMMILKRLGPEVISRLRDHGGLMPDFSAKISAGPLSGTARIGTRPLSGGQQVYRCPRRPAPPPAAASPAATQRGSDPRRPAVHLDRPTADPGRNQRAQAPRGVTGSRPDTGRPSVQPRPAKSGETRPNDSFLIVFAARGLRSAGREETPLPLSACHGHISGYNRIKFLVARTAYRDVNAAKNILAAGLAVAGYTLPGHACGADVRHPDPPGCSRPRNRNPGP